VHVSSSPPHEEPPIGSIESLRSNEPAGLSKLNSVDPAVSVSDAAVIRRFVEVDVVSRRVRLPDGPKTIDGAGAYRSKSSGIP